MGDTPLALTFQCDQIGDRRYRIERDGCEPAEGILNARVAPGRIVAASFCFAINYAFQCTQHFVPVNVRLTCHGAQAGEAPRAGGEAPVAVDQLPPRVDLRKNPSPTALSPEAMQAQLKSLKDLRDRGVISEQQYQQERERLLNALGY
ncbi:MAG: SHOCT domain-containing protein [Candidatus Binatia bacterium]